MLWGNDDPLFPATRVALGASHQFEAVGLEGNHWGSASPIRSIFKDAFEGAGLPYFNPHSFRHTLVRLGEKVCQTPEQFKAWSQNLGHEGVLTTFYSYGDVSARRQGELIQGLGKPSVSQTMTVEDMAEAVVRKMREADANASARTAI